MQSPSDFFRALLIVTNVLTCTISSDIYAKLVQAGSVVPSLILQVAILPSVIVGESAGMLKFWAASEACPECNAVTKQSANVPVPLRAALTSPCAMVFELVCSPCRDSTYRSD